MKYNFKACRLQRKSDLKPGDHQTNLIACYSDVLKSFKHFKNKLTRHKSMFLFNLKFEYYFNAYD